jgi:nucleoside 2-deoxyribosyltransferase
VTARIYLAGPGGFDAGGRRWHALVCDAVTRAGFDVLDPWTASAAVFDDAYAQPEGPARIAALCHANAIAGATNARLIAEASAVLALLDGTDVDSGTAAEIGYAAAVGTPVIAYRTDWRTSGDNAAALVNLQVEHFILASGGEIVTAPSGIDDDTLLDHAIAALKRTAAT